ncbi:serine hydrolase domain-containing protein [Saccharothrix sp. Mg75]|uniref:serine hydrolase domain-containing protein n=1 Tax=Saccharothrix sp. Mg75 TaxID=3445357 RepID=UPI003EE916B6
MTSSRNGAAWSRSSRGAGRGGVRRAGVRRAGVVALVASLLVGLVAPGVAVADRAVAAGQDRPELRAIMRETVDSGIAGMQLRVRDERGEWVGSAGVRRLGGAAEPPTDGRFRIGSATKTITATVVLQLVAEGAVGLDASAADHLPGLGLDPGITVRMLLQHTSGVSNHTGDVRPDGTVEPGITWSGPEWVEGRFRTYRPVELARYALSRPARFAPGTGWSYSNTNYALALLLIEAVTGNSYADEVRRRVLRPLGMRDTVVPGTSAGIPGPHAHAYYRYQKDGREEVVDITRQNPSWVPGAGDLVSTTADLAAFMAGLTGGTLLPAPLLAEMREPHPATGYGLGLFVLDLGPGCGGAVLNHNGGVQGYATLMYRSVDGSRTLTASLTYVDDAELSLQGVFRESLGKLLDEVFCGGQG